MRNTTKLLPVLLLGSALGGCSMAGISSPFSNDYAQSQPTQSQQYWGASSSCQPQPQQPTCRHAYPTAQSQVQTYPYSMPASAPAPQTYVQTEQNYQSYAGQQAYQGQPVYQGQPTYQSQSVYQGQPTYQTQPVYQGQPTYQTQPVYQGQQVYAQNGYGPSPYVSPRSAPSRGLRQSYTYGTLGATIYDVDNDIYGVQGRLGWQSKSFYGAEVEGSFGVTDENDTFDSGTGPVETSVEIDTQIAAFVVGRYPISKKLNVLGRVGYHSTEFDVEFDDGTTVLEDTFSQDGIAYGLGAEYAFDPKTSIRADFTRYDINGPDAEAVSLAISRKF